jgi:predicted signal transduction protein with EAL and GGDEF domain
LLSERIIEALRAPYDLEGHQADIGASIGIALVPLNGSDPEALLKCADLALYRAKARGRGGFAFFESAMTDSAQDRRALGGASRSARTRSIRSALSAADRRQDRKREWR